MAAVIGTVVSTVLSGLMGSSSSRKARKKAKKVMERQQAEHRLFAKEELRKMQITHRRQLGTARSQIAGSGFTGYGATSEAYINELRHEQDLRKKHVVNVGVMGGRAIQAAGEAQMSGYKDQENQAYLGMAMSLGSQFNWGLDANTTTTNKTYKTEQVNPNATGLDFDY
jgi:hypothetical protein